MTTIVTLDIQRVELPRTRIKNEYRHLLRSQGGTPALAAPGKVSRDGGVIHGVICAETGIFKDGRGRFDHGDIHGLVRLMNEFPSGLQSFWEHEHDAGSYLGKLENPRVLRLGGTSLAVADMRLSSLAANAPGFGNLRDYVLKAALEPEAIGMSFVLGVDQQHDSRNLPPRFVPEELHSCDAVATGTATSRFCVSAAELSVSKSASDEPEYGSRLWMARYYPEVHELIRRNRDCATAGTN